MIWTAAVLYTGPAMRARCASIVRRTA